MSGGWVGSGRRAELPPDWPERRRLVIARDRTCRQAADGLCEGPTNQVDHVDHRRRWDHRPENLQLLCEYHHRAKSSREGNAVKPPPRNRPRERHPGLM